MKISFNWLKSYLDIPLDATAAAGLLTDIGLEVEGMEQVETIPGSLAGVIVGEVLTCSKHPDADRLSLTTVNIGQGSPLDIVCGAPNVAKGQRVMVAQVGCTLHPTEGNPIMLKETRIRGAISQGMLCAADELGLGNDHSGILVLPPDTPIGQPAALYFQLELDTVFDVNLTPNRSDATCHLGVARDLYAALEVHHGFQGKLRLPEVAEGKDLIPVGGAKQIKVTIAEPKLCPRYAGILLRGIRIGESPDWLKRRLKSVGVRPINNVVDVTNFVLHELGQPLHAFDARALHKGEIRVKTLAEGTPMHTLDQQERRLTAGDLIICDGEDHPMCIAGVFGGMHSGVQADTESIFLESAHFQAQSIRRTSMHHQLRTDAARIYEKGSDPTIPVFALTRAVKLLEELAGAIPASPVVDVIAREHEPVAIDVAFSYVRGLTGAPISDEEIMQILTLLDMTPMVMPEGICRVQIPSNKSDVRRPVDVVEEILRIYGFNRVPLPEIFRTTLSDAPVPDRNLLSGEIGSYLCSQGFSEMMGVSLSQSGYYRNSGWPLREEELVYIHNTSHALLDIMRPEMVMSGLEVLLHNQNRQQPNIKLFEWGKSYRNTPEGIKESEHLSLFMAGNRHPESWQVQGAGRTSFYSMKGMVLPICTQLGWSGFEEKVFQDEMPFEYGISLQQGSREFARFGKLDSKLTQAFGLREDIFHACLAWDLILQKSVNQKIKFKEVNRFPVVRRDLALIVDNSVKFSDIADVAKSIGKKQIARINLFDVYSNEKQLGKGKRSYAVSYIFENQERTLQDKEVDAMIDQLLIAYQAKLGASLRN